MNFKRALLILLAGIVSGTLHAQLTLQWTQVLRNTHCTPSDPVVGGMDVDADGNSYFLYYNRVAYTCEYLVYLKKSNPSGLPIWEVLVDTVSEYSGAPWAMTTQLRWSANGSLALGWSSDYQSRIYKYSESGTRLWSWQRDVYNNTNSYCRLMQIEQDAVGNVFIALDIRDSGAAFVLGMHYLKFEPNGNIFWEIIPMPQTNTTGFDDLFPDGQGGATMFFGKPYTPGIPHQAVSLHINSWGMTNWQNTEDDRIPYGGTMDNAGNLLLLLKEWPSFVSRYVYKYSPSGNLIWQREIMSPNSQGEIYGILSDLQSNFYVWGDSGGDFRLSKYDSAGNFAWRYTYQPSIDLNEFGYRVQEIAGYLYIFGYQSPTLSQPTTNLKLFLVKIDNLGNLVSDEQLPYGEAQVTNALGNYAANDQYGNLFLTSNVGNLRTTVRKFCTEGCNLNVSGTAYVDLDSTCVLDSNKQRLPEQVIRFDQGSLYAMTDSTGHYAFGLDSGTVSYQLLSLPFWTNACMQGPYSLTVSPSSFYHDSLDFGMYAPPAPNLSVSIASTPARPGFSQIAGIQYANLGGIAVAPRIVLFLDSSAVFDYSIPAPDTVQGNRVVWLADTLDIFDFGRIEVFSTLQTSATLGSPYSHQVEALPIQGDLFHGDNRDSVNQLVVGSYDPNEKSAQPSGEGPFGEIPLDQFEWVNYQIRFQNTGTDTAFRVVIRDTVDAKLDLASFQMGVSSHSYNLEITDGNVLQWTFDNILLPDSFINEPLSHGFIKFRIARQDDLQLGDTVRNKAAIYFDFNLPITTNEVVHHINLYTATPAQQHEDSAIEIFPNPATNHLTVKWRWPLLTQSARLNLYDLNGISRFQAECQGNSGTLSIDLNALSAGFYLREVRSANARWVQKVIVTR